MFKIFRKKRLLILAAPTGCGKSTFKYAALSEQPPPLAEKILVKAFSRNFSNIKPLRMRSLRKRFFKSKSFRKFIQNHDNFILEIDTTCPRTVDNLILLPIFLREFHSVLSVQIYIPFDVWLVRIRDRQLNAFQTSRFVNQILRVHQSSERDVLEAENLYHRYYYNWEYYLNGLGVSNQLCISTIDSSVLKKPFNKKRAI